MLKCKYVVMCSEGALTFSRIKSAVYHLHKFPPLNWLYVVDGETGEFVSVAIRCCGKIIRIKRGSIQWKMVTDYEAYRYGEERA